VTSATKRSSFAIGPISACRGTILRVGEASSTERPAVGSESSALIACVIFIFLTPSSLALINVINSLVYILVMSYVGIALVLLFYDLRRRETDEAALNPHTLPHTTGVALGQCVMRSVHPRFQDISRRCAAVLAIVAYRWRTELRT
jgi:hypothetical protein